MSYVTDTLVVASSTKYGDEATLKALNLAIQDEELDGCGANGQEFRLMPWDCAGGRKAFSAFVAVAAFNYFSTDEIREVVDAMALEHFPDGVVVLTDRTSCLGEGFEIFNIAAHEITMREREAQKEAGRAVIREMQKAADAALAQSVREMQP